MKNLINGMKNLLDLQNHALDYIKMKVSDIQIHEKMAGLFKIDSDTFDKISKSMKESGYDTSQPIVVGRIKGIGDLLVDGHTRLKAAIETGIKEIPVKIKNFENLEDAQFYTFKRQSERRNLTQSDILNASMLLEKKKKRDGSGRSTDKLSQELGVSASTIQHAQTVARNASENDLKAINDGEKSINEVYQGIKKKNAKEIENTKVSTQKTKLEKQNSEIKRIEGIAEINEIESSLEDSIHVIEKEEKNQTEKKNENKTNKVKEKKEASITQENKIVEEILYLLIKENQTQAFDIITKHFENYLSEEFKKEIETMIEQKKNNNTN